MNSEIRQNFSNPGDTSRSHERPGMIPAGPDGKITDTLMNGRHELRVKPTTLARRSISMKPILCRVNA